jgi:ubiquinone/menaquinone biosynthesis C-methylase UbiE
MWETHNKSWEGYANGQPTAYGAEAAAEYDRAYSHVSAHFLPFLLRAARLGPGQRVLDVATETGIAAEAALGVVGSAGSVVATDISREMVEKARERIASWSNAAVSVEDGQALSFPEQSFDVVCSLGLMFSPIPRPLYPGFVASCALAAGLLYPF